MGAGFTKEKSGLETSRFLTGYIPITGIALTPRRG